MATFRSRPVTRSSTADTSAAVDAFMVGLVHPHKEAIQALRRIVLGIDSSILEGVKWNAPSFRTHEYFATTHLRAKNGIGLVLHLGAKARGNQAIRIDDADRMLAWLADDRAMVSFVGVEDLHAKTGALRDLVRQWLRFV